MPTHLFSTPSAAVIMALFLPACSQASAPGSNSPTPEPPHVIVDRLLEHHQELSLTKKQEDDLAALSVQLRRDRGRLQIAGLDRVPGKSVPRYERVYKTSTDARRMAFKLLSPPQRLEAEKLLGAEE